MPTARRIRPYLVAVAGVALLAACTDKRLRKLHAGMSRDSVMAVVSGPPSADDSMPNIYRRGQFFTRGQMFEVLMVDFKGRKAPRSFNQPETAKDEELTPLVLSNGKLVAWGWKSADSVSKANSLQLHGMR